MARCVERPDALRSEDVEGLVQGVRARHVGRVACEADQARNRFRVGQQPEGRHGQGPRLVAVPLAGGDAEQLVDRGWVELIGTDCHGMMHIEAVQGTLTAPYLHKLIDSGKLLNPGL